MNALAERALYIARGFVGVRELRKNRGVEVDMFIREGGGLDPEGAHPWCAGFVSYCIVQAMRDTGGPWQFRPAPSVLKLISRNPNLVIGAAAPGSIFTDMHTKYTGHTGFIVEVYNDGHLRTIEGNTGPGPGAPAKDREGDGVYERFDRRLEDIDGFLAIG